MYRKLSQLWISGALAAGLLAAPGLLSAQQPNQPLDEQEARPSDPGQARDGLQQDQRFQDQDPAAQEGQEGRATDRPLDQQPPPPDQQRGQLDRQQPGEFDPQPGSADPQQGQPGGRGQAGLGVAVVPEPGTAGVRVARIYPDSPAEAAGIREGDRILEIDGQQIMSVDDLLATIRTSQPGRTVQVAIDRNGVRQTLEAMLETRAEALSRPGGDPGAQFGGAPPWTDDLSAHISMLEQEVQRLSQEIADLKAMLTRAPMGQRQDDARSEQGFDQPHAGAPTPSGQFEQDVRGQSTDQLRPDAPPPAEQPSQQPPAQPTSPPGQDQLPSGQSGDQDT